MTHLTSVPAVEQRATCKYCGSDKGFREYGRVTCDASRTSRSVVLVDGVAKAKWDHVERDGGFIDDFEADGVSCRGCEREASRLSDLVGPPLTIAPGDRVLCPDGFRAIVATVDEERRTLTVENWHEEFSFGDVDRWAVAA